MFLLPVLLFTSFVVLIIGMSFYFAKKTKSSEGYFAAGGEVHWAVNGLAFAGDYLSAASFLGICGLIATVGYDGFLYSIGFLAGWVVALFVVAEPLKRMGKYTFADALDNKFNSKGIKLAAAISTLVVSMFYLVPQMVGAGVLVTPLIGLSHTWGVVLVGFIVIMIVATAGMASTTFVQFVKGSLLIIFSVILCVAIMHRGLSTEPTAGGEGFYKYKELPASYTGDKLQLDNNDYKFIEIANGRKKSFAKLSNNGIYSWWLIDKVGNSVKLYETQYTSDKNGNAIVNGKQASKSNQLRPVGNLEKIAGSKESTGPILNPIKYLSLFASKDTTIKRWGTTDIKSGKETIKVYYPIYSKGSDVMRPGLKYKLEGTFASKLDFISLMLALFFGTAALPHVLIRYYTVKTDACTRKSTITAIFAIGFFYILTMFIGLGAMSNGTINLVSDNMSAPLLAKSFGIFLFSAISAIAFATVLGTVSGLIIASSGAIAHDICDKFAGAVKSEKQKIYIAKIASLGVGIVAIVLGIIFEGMNVSFLVGWAFAVAAAANLPAIIMIIFWKRTTAKGVIASVVTGVLLSVILILLSPDMFAEYGLSKSAAIFPLSNPGIVTIPISFIVLIVVSLMSKNRGVCNDK